MSDVHSSGSNDSDYQGEKQRKIDKISSKWSLKELGEGLKIGIVAFFLIALIAAAILFFMRHHNSKVDQNVSIEVDTNFSTQENESTVNHCLSIPNQLTKRAFPQSGDGVTSEMPTITHDELDFNKVNLSLIEPAVSVDEHEWIVKDSSSSIHLKKKSKHNSLSFEIKEGVDYNVFVYINDTLIVMKRIP